MSNKVCTKCLINKPLTEFSKHKGTKDGMEYHCKECRKEAKRKYRRSERGKEMTRSYYWRNVERERARLRKKNGTIEYIEYQREYREKNRSKVREYKRSWDANKQDYYAVLNHIKFAKAKGLTIKWDEEVYKGVIRSFEHKCALSDEYDELHMDHFVAIETGHCGTYKGNMIPLSSSLNSSKNDKNPFEWIKSQPQKLSNNFKKLVKKLAFENGLNVEDFRNFVYWCYENKRTTEQIKSDSLPSLELWKRRK